MAEEVPIYEISLDQVSDMMAQLTANMDEQRRFRDDMRSYSQANAKIDRARNEQLAKTGKLWKTIRSDVNSTYTLMLKMSRMGIGVGMAGLGLGVAGMYGFNRMSADTGNERRQAMGLGGGTTIGQMKAFDVNMKKILADPLSILSSFQKIRETPSESWKERTLLDLSGITGEQASEMTTSDLLIKTLPVQKKIIDKLFATFKAKGQEVPLNQPGFLASQGLGMYEGNLEPLRVLHAINEREIPEAISNYMANKKSMNVVDVQAEELQRFNRQWEESLTEIATSFKRTIEPLAPQLGGLTKEIAGTIKAIVASGDAQKAVTTVMGGLEKTVKYLASQEGQKEIELFWNNLKELNINFHNLLHPLDYMDKQFFNSGVYDPNVSVIPQKPEMMQKAIEVIRQHESSNNPLAISPTGPVGAMQVTGDTIAKYFPDQISKDPNSPHYFPGTSTPNWKEHRINWLKSHPGIDVKAGEMEAASVLAKGGFLDDPGKLGKIWREQYNKEKNSPKADKMAMDIQADFNKYLPEIKKNEKASIDPRKSFFQESTSLIPKLGSKIGGAIYDIAPHSTNELIERNISTTKSIGQSIKTKWDYLIGDDPITKQQEEAKKAYMEQYKKEHVNDKKPDNLSYNLPAKDVKRIGLGVKIGTRPGWDYLIGDDPITKQQEEAKKAYMEQYKKEHVNDKKPDNLSYNLPAKDVKRIELGVKIGTRPGSDIFGQAVALS